MNLNKSFASVSAVLLAAGVVATSALPIYAGNDFSITSNGQTSVLQASGLTGNENVSDILGDAQYFGITANKFEFNGEAETTLAVKEFDHQGAGSLGQTGQTDKAAGSDHAYFIVGSVDSPFMVKGVGADIITPESEKDKYTNSTSGKLTFVNESKSDIDAYIDGMLSHVSDESKRLAGKDSIKDYTVIPANQMTIDVTSAGSKTVYINVNKSKGLTDKLKESSGVTIKKNKNQKVVLNFTDDSVNINKLEIEQDGKKYGGDSLANVSTRDNDIAEDLIFNMPNAKNVELHNVTGAVLAPKATIDTYDVTGGWLVADKVSIHCEHHFTDGKLPTSKKFDVKQNTPAPTDTPQTTDTPQPTEQPTEQPTQPDLKDAIFRVHAFEVMNNVAKPEENLKIEVTKTDYNIPENEQNESDKKDTRTSDKIKVNEVKTLTTNSEGDTETELDKGSYKVEAKRVNAPVVEKADQTKVYVHSDATLTGNAIEEGNKFVVKKVEAETSDTPTPTEQPDQPQPTETPDTPTKSDAKVSVVKVDQNGKPVIGAKLAVTLDDKTVDSWTTDENAYVLSNLEDGKEYVVEETYAPVGYELAPDQKFTYDAKGDNLVIKVVDNKKADEEEVTPAKPTETPTTPTSKPTVKPTDTTKTVTPTAKPSKTTVKPSQTVKSSKSASSSKYVAPKNNPKNAPTAASGNRNAMTAGFAMILVGAAILVSVALVNALKHEED